MHLQPPSIQRVGDTLIFPEICAVSGQRDRPLARRDEKLLFFPYWSLALIPLGFLFFIVAFAMLRKEQRVVYFLSDSGKATVLKRRLAVIALLLVAIAAMVIGAMGWPWLFLISVVAIGLAGYLYRQICFPFRFGTTPQGAVFVHRLPPSFGGEKA